MTATPTLKTLLDYALDAQTRGFYVFPLRPNGKEPAGEVVPSGVLDASNDPEVIRAWWTKNPNYNIAVALGPSNLVGWDFDTIAPFSWMPNSLTVRSGRILQDGEAGGIHIYTRGSCKTRSMWLDDKGNLLDKDHRDANGNVININEKDADGKLLHDSVGEIRSRGAYLVWDGSIHPKSGNRYEIINDIPLAESPEQNTDEPVECGPAIGTDEQNAIADCVEAAFNESGIDYKARKNYKQEGGGFIWLVVCPWKIDHTGGKDFNSSSAAIMLPSGKLTYACQHAHCEGIRQWKELRAWMEEKVGHVFTFGKAPEGTVLISGKPAGTALVPAPEEFQVLEFLKIHKTELGNAYRFASAHKDVAHYCYESGTWFIWNGKVWAEDDGSRVARGMKGIAKSIQKEAKQITDEKKSDKHLKWGLRSESRSIISNALFLAQSEEGVPIDLEQLDAESTDYLFNAFNMTLDLQNNKFYLQNRDDLITKTSRVVYDPTATCLKFEKFLEEVLPDPEVRAYVQRAAGLSLTGFTGEHALFLLYGTGRNGKSTLVDTLRYVLGDYATQSDWGSFTESRGGNDRVNNDIARLRGARFVVASEAKADAKLAEGVIKNITGGEAVAARFLFQEFFEFVPKFKLWLTTNHKPRIVGTDPAIWSRVNLINFNVQIPVEKRDKQLSKKLREEASGILNWMLRGYQEWEKTGLNPPEVVQAATEEYRKDSDILSHFIEEKCDVDPSFEIGAGSLYQSYKVWSAEAGEYFTMSIQQFNQALEPRGFLHKKTNSGHVWRGLRLKLNSGNQHPDPPEEPDADTPLFVQ